MKKLEKHGRMCIIYKNQKGIFYEESKNWAWVLVNSRDAEKEEGKMKERRRGRDSIRILHTFFWRKSKLWQGVLCKKCTVLGRIQY